MSKDYERGFEDAVAHFEEAINRTIDKGEYNLDKVVSLLYLLDLKRDEIYEEADLEGFVYYIDDFSSFNINNLITDRLNEIFKGDDIDE